jgi:putative flippase GtrA
LGIKQNIAREDVKSFYLYFLTALFGAAVNFFTQIPLRDWFLVGGLDFDNALSWSIIVSYLSATVVTFIPSKLFAFSAKGTGNTSRESIKFLLIALLALIVQESISVFTFKNIASVYFTNISEFWQIKTSHLVGMGFSFLANFFGHRLVTFKSTGVYDKFKAKRR